MAAGADPSEAELRELGYVRVDHVASTAGRSPYETSVCLSELNARQVSSRTGRVVTVLDSGEIRALEVWVHEEDARAFLTLVGCLSNDRSLVHPRRRD